MTRATFRSSALGAAVLAGAFAAPATADEARGAPDRPLASPLARVPLRLSFEPALLPTLAPMSSDDEVFGIVRVGFAFGFADYEKYDPAKLGPGTTYALFAGFELNRVKLFRTFYPELDLEFETYTGTSKHQTSYYSYTTFSDVPGYNASAERYGGALLLKYGEGADQAYVLFGAGQSSYSSDLPPAKFRPLDIEGKGLYTRLGIGGELHLSTVLFFRAQITYTRGQSSNDGRGWEQIAIAFGFGLAILT